jgi:hypothetical protein
MASIRILWLATNADSKHGYEKLMRDPRIARNYTGPTDETPLVLHFFYRGN